MTVQHVQIKEMIRERWNRRADTFDKSPGHGIHAGKEKDAWISLFQRVLGNERLEILDVGTGTGVIALLLAELGHRVTGVDIAEQMVHHGREKAKNLHLAVDFRIGDAEELPFQNDSFDVVINRHVVWSLPNPEKAMAEWKRVLRHGGKLVIMDSNWGKTAPLYKRVWRFFAQLLILLTERRNLWTRQGHRQMEKHLPMRQKKRPEADIEILRGLGFQVEVMKVDIPRWDTLLGYLKYGYFRGEKFLLAAIKEQGCRQRQYG
ncbi:MAG: class I SAM-dependent methyltransferase [Desulforudis sp.]|nr:MAG: class I SAM-dependent methyltransferase [Desulforudis sp.]